MENFVPKTNFDESFTTPDLTCSKITFVSSQTPKVVDLFDFSYYNLQSGNHKLKQLTKIDNLYKANVHSMSFNDNHQYLAVGFGSGHVIIYDYPELSQVAKYNGNLNDFQFLVQAVDWKGFNTVVSACDKALVEYNLLYKTKATLLVFPERTITAMCTSNFHELIAVALDDCSIEVYNFLNTKIQTLGGDGQNSPHEGKIYVVQIKKIDGSWFLISAANDNNIVLWDIPGCILKRPSNYTHY